MSISHPFSSIVAHVQIHDVAKARPEVQKTVDTMLKKGKWSVPGYRVSRTSQLGGRSLTGVGEIRRPPIDVEWLAWSPMENESDYGNIDNLTSFVSRKNGNDRYAVFMGELPSEGVSTRLRKPRNHQGFLAPQVAQRRSRIAMMRVFTDMLC